MKEFCTSDLADTTRVIQSAQTIMITTHVNPDGDGIGSGLALQRGLRTLGKQVDFVAPSKLAGIYAFLPDFSQIAVVETEEEAAAQKSYDCIISCDCGDLKRLGSIASWPRTQLINLDHHASNDRFGDVNIVDEQAECTGVVVEHLLTKLGVELDKDMATGLYAAVVFDTGRFMHSNTTAHTLKWTAKLLEKGINAAEINRAMTYTKSLKDLEIQALGLQHIQVDEEESRLAGISLSAEDITTVGEPDDWGDLVEIPRSLAGNQVAYLLREQPCQQQVRCSLRSNPPYEVGPVASQLGGGGHLQAAGCTIDGDLNTAQQLLLPLLRAAAQR